MNWSRWISIIWKVSLVLLLLGIGAAAAFLISQSSVMAVNEIVIDGNRAVSSDQILEKAGPLLRGQSIIRPAFDAVSGELGTIPYIDGVDFERDLPGTVIIHIRERRPLVCLQASGGKSLILGSDGRVLTEEQDAAAAADAAVPLLNTKEPCPAEAGGQADCEDVMTGISFLVNIPVSFNYEFAAITVDHGDIRLSTTTGVGVHFGSLDNYGFKFEVLRQLLARSSAADVQVSIDVSVPERPVTREETPPSVPAEPVAGTAAETPPAVTGPDAATSQLTEPR